MVKQHRPALPSPPPQLLRLVTLKPKFTARVSSWKRRAAFRGLIWSKGARELLRPFMRGGWMVSVKPSSCCRRRRRFCLCCCRSSVWKKSRMCQNKHGAEVRLVREAEPLPNGYRWLFIGSARSWSVLPGSPCFSLPRSGPLRKRPLVDENLESRAQDFSNTP